MIKYQKLLINTIKKLIKDTYNNKQINAILKPVKENIYSQLYPIYMLAYVIVILISIILILVILLLLIVIKKM